MSTICPICLETFGAFTEKEFPFVLPCSHFFHLDCIKKSVTDCGQFCPYCRRAYSDMVSEGKMNLSLAAILDQEIQIFLKDLTGPTQIMIVRSTYSEKKLFEMVAALTGIKIEEIMLTHESKNLKRDGERMLGNIGIKADSFIYLLLRLKGGTKLNIN